MHFIRFPICYCIRQLNGFAGFVKGNRNWFYVGITLNLFMVCGLFRLSIIIWSISIYC